MNDTKSGAASVASKTVASSLSVRGSVARPRVGDRVTAPGNPFWMTVTEVLRNGFVRCRFGSIGCDAGNYHADELRGAS